MIFYKGTYSDIWIKLQANEFLGILESDYVEDYFGQDGQISLYNTTTEQYIPVLLGYVLGTLEGSTPVDSVPDGAYQIRGRVRDIAGNYSIFSSVESPSGGERVILLEFLVRSGQGVSVDLGAAIIVGGYTLDFSRDSEPVSYNLFLLQNPSINMEIDNNFQVTAKKLESNQKLDMEIGSDFQVTAKMTESSAL